MYKFNYHRAKSVEDAAKMLADLEEPKLLAGGMSLLPMMKHRLAHPTELVDLCELDELRGISVDRDTVRIRAMTPHAVVAASPEVAKAIPALAKLAGGIGDPHCRNRGTIGGSLAHADPGACYPSAILGLGATIRTNRREIPGDEFFLGMFETVLDDGELITEVAFPIPDSACYIKFPQPASRFALVGIFLGKKSSDVRIGVTGAGPSAFRFNAAESALGGMFAPEAIDDCEVSSKGLNADIFADPDYRAHLIKELTKRAVESCHA